VSDQSKELEQASSQQGKAGTYSRRAMLRATLGAAGVGLLAAHGLSLDRLFVEADAAGEPLVVRSGVPGVPDAYLRLPKPFKSVKRVPANGGTVKALVLAYGVPPVAHGQNKWWQGLEKRLGLDSYQPILAPQPSYGDKVATIVASGDIPELFYLNYNQTNTPLATYVQQGVFLDITDYVTGSALRDYPNLAVFPGFMWEATKMNGRIMGVPRPSGRASQIASYRVDWARKVGAHVPPRNAKEVHDMLVAFSKKDPDGDHHADTWGLGNYGDWGNSLVQFMYRVPNNWRKNPDGSLTYYIETPQYKQALAYERELWADGAYYPDSASMDFAKDNQLYLSGKIGLEAEGASIYGPTGQQATLRKVDPGAQLAYVIPPGWNGGQGITWNLPGIFGFTAISSAVGNDKNRVKELLHILDWFAAPFGSEEYLYKNYGIAGRDYKMGANGVIMPTTTGQTEVNGDMVSLTGGLLVNYTPDHPQTAVLETTLQKKILKLGVDDPTANLFSPTAVRKGAALGQMVYDGETAVITGRQPLSYVDTTIKNWRSRGGDQIRTEYEQALKKNH
jgi:putative aldouronate transport system substrate-binding protein